MTTSNEALVASPILAAAVSAARTFGPPATKKGDPCLTGDARRKVIVCAINAMDTAAQAMLAALSDEELHRWIGAVLDNAGCLLAKAPGYITTVKDQVGFPNAAESVIGPKSIRNVVKNLAKQREKAQPKSEKAAKPADTDEDAPIVIVNKAKPAPKIPPARKTTPAKGKKT
jgi:hypothetical protein